MNAASNDGIKIALNCTVSAPLGDEKENGVVMSDEINRLLEMARRVEMTPAQAEEQRRSFAYGNTKIENDSITWDSVNQAAEELKAKK